MKLGKQSGFSFLELILALLIISLLVSIAAPNVTKSIKRADEAVMRENLFVTRKAIDDFFTDIGRYPDSLDELVGKKYLRSKPFDPLTKNAHDWILESGDEDREIDGIINIRSGAQGSGLDGTQYNTW